jgi:hypothetical protein
VFGFIITRVYTRVLITYNVSSNDFDIEFKFIVANILAIILIESKENGGGLTMISFLSSK